MSRKGPVVGVGMLDFVEDLRIGRVVTCMSPVSPIFEHKVYRVSIFISFFHLEQTEV